MIKDILYAVAGAVTGPVGGAVAGYLYAREENNLASMQNLPETKNPLISALIGMAGGTVIGLGGAYYGNQLSKSQDRTQQFITSGQLSYQAPTPIEQAVHTLESNVSTLTQPHASHWQNKVTAARASAPSQEPIR
jgi:hypothetical protein